MKLLTWVNSAIFWGFSELRRGVQKNILNAHKKSRAEEANEAISF